MYTSGGLMRYESIATSLVTGALFVVVIAVLVMAVRVAALRSESRSESEGFAQVFPSQVESLSKACELLVNRNERGAYTYDVPNRMTIGKDLVLEGGLKREIRRVKGDVNIDDASRSSSHLFTSSGGMTPGWVVVDGNVHVGRQGVLRPPESKSFTVLFVNGDLRVDGSINVDGGATGHVFPLYHRGKALSVDDKEENKGDGTALRVRMGAKKATGGSGTSTKVYLRPVDSRILFTKNMQQTQTIATLEAPHWPGHVLDISSGRPALVRRKRSGNARWVIFTNRAGDMRALARVAKESDDDGKVKVDFLEYNTSKEAFHVRSVSGFELGKDTASGSGDWSTTTDDDSGGGGGGGRNIVVAKDVPGTVTRPVVAAQGADDTTVSPEDDRGQRGKDATGLQTGGGGSSAPPPPTDDDAPPALIRIFKSFGKAGNAFGGGRGGLLYEDDEDHAAGGGTLCIICNGRVGGVGRISARGEDAKSVGGGGGGGGCVVLLCRTASFTPGFLDVSGGTGSGRGGDGGKGSALTIQGYGRRWWGDYVGETGRVTLKNTLTRGVVAKVDFRHWYLDPVVLAYIPTRRGGQAYEVRVRNVTSRGCEIFGLEPPGYDKWHLVEEACYVVLEKGVHRLEGGGVVEAGSLRTSSAGKGGDGGVDVRFENAFASEPAVLHSLNSYDNERFLSTQAKKVRRTGFRVQQQVAETGVATREETIAWAAFQPGSFDAFEASRADSAHNVGQDDKPHLITFAKNYDRSPDVVVKGNSSRGGNGFWARGSGLWTAEKHGVFAEEDRTRDREAHHTREWFSWVAAKPNTDLRPKNRA